MSVTIVPSKLQVPVPPPKTLDRPRLKELLGDAIRRPVTLIAADAGFGKSTAVATFLLGFDRPVVWYRLDPTDSDPAMFAAHLLEGLCRHVPQSAYRSARRGLILATDWNAAAYLLSHVTNRLQRDVVIVLDDFHLLAAPGANESLVRFVEALPLRAHLVILTRAHPDFPISRWRVQGRLVELGADDLRFTVSELRALLVDLHGLQLSDASLHVVAAKTEGWPAGITLAIHASAAQGAAATAQALGALSGSSREIYDYLAQEAFARQASDTQRFLLATAIVPRFNLPLAEALLGRTRPRNREILDHLERSHLFVVPLDRERRWYRYHHLFQEFLQRTAAERDADWVREVHLKAAAWWERNEQAGEALRHLVEAGDVERAAALLGTLGLDLYAQGQIETLRRCLEAIPDDHWPRAPRLYLLRGLTEMAWGDTGEAVRSLEDARRRLRASRDTEGEMYALRWLVHVLLWEGGVELLASVIPALDEIEHRLNELSSGARARALELMARVAHLRGDVRRSERLFRRAVTAARASGDDWTYLGCIRYQAHLWFDLGRFRETEAHFEELLHLTRRRGWWHEHAHVRVEVAEVLLAIGRDKEAEQHLAEAHLLAPTIPCQVLYADLTTNAAQVAAHRGGHERAEALLRELLMEGEKGTRYGRFRFDAQLDLALLLASREPDEARRLAGSAFRVADQYGPFRVARALLTFGIITAAQEHCRQAADLFGTLDAQHWSALASLHAAALTPAEARAGMAGAAADTLRAVPKEGWDFLFAQTSPELLAAYKDDPVVGLRIVSFMQTTPPVAPSRITVRCLGPFQVIRQSQVLAQDAWPRAAPKRLLQYLLLQDRPVHREEVTEVLWPDLEPRHASNQLRVALSQLRRVLEPELSPRQPSDLILTFGPTIALARDLLDVDLDRFRRVLARASSLEGIARRAALAEAISIYIGDLLADHPFEEWAYPYRDRLLRQYLDGLSGLAEAEETEEDYRTAAAHWLTVIERDPGAEHAHRGLIRSYVALGRTADALRAFESCRKALADLGVVPSPETLSLRDRMLHMDRTGPGNARITETP